MGTPWGHLFHRQASNSPLSFQTPFLFDFEYLPALNWEICWDSARYIGLFYSVSSVDTFPIFRKCVKPIFFAVLGCTFCLFGDGWSALLKLQLSVIVRCSKFRSQVLVIFHLIPLLLWCDDILSFPPLVPSYFKPTKHLKKPIITRLVFALSLCVILYPWWLLWRIQI